MRLTIIDDDGVHHDVQTNLEDMNLDHLETSVSIMLAVQAKRIEIQTEVIQAKAAMRRVLFFEATK